MLFNDIRELKILLKIDPANPAEDRNLLFFLRYATDLIEEYLGRKISYQSRTEYYSGTGTQNLLLRCRPVYVTPAGDYSPLTVYADHQGYFGSNPKGFQADALPYGKDYCLQIDQDDGGSRSAILIRINNYWEKPVVRQMGLLAPFIGRGMGNIKVVYTAGYTVDTLPPVFRLACGQLVAAIRYLWPLGMPLASESYEERSISLFTGQNKSYLLGITKEILAGFRNWSF